MADNLSITAGTGTTVATDDIAGVHYQRVKLAQGADGAAVDVSAAAPLQVSLENNAANATAVKVNIASGGVASGAIASGAVASGAVASGAFASGALAAGAVAAGASSFVKLEDAASADGDAGVAVMAVRKATPANVSGTDGDYEQLQMSAGRLWTSATVDAALPAGTNAIGKLASNSGVDIGDVDVLTVSGQTLAFNAGAASASTIRVVSASDDPIITAIEGNVAHDDPDSGNGSKIAAKAKAGLSGVTLVAGNDRTDVHAGLDGALIIRPHCGLEDIVSGVAEITDGASTSIIASAGAGIKNYITTAIVSNTSATAVEVDLRDGAAGTVKATLPVPANTSGVVCNLPVPLPFSAATAVCADPSSAQSTITVTLIGFKSKV